MEWLELVHRLQRIGQAGLTYCHDPYDRQRYEELLEIAATVASTAIDFPSAELAKMFRAEQGYATPKLDVRAVVPREGKLLLVKEQQDGRWSLPGGWADIGESPSAITRREVREESGLEVAVTKLLAVYDKAKHEHPAELWYCYKLFFLCEITGGTLQQSLETTDLGFFGADDLPPLSLQRVTERQVRRMFEHCRQRDLPTDFD